LEEVLAEETTHDVLVKTNSNARNWKKRVPIAGGNGMNLVAVMVTTKNVF
jgi:hypothetical protein